MAEGLARHNLLVEVGLALLNARGKALILGIVDEGLDGLSLTLGRGLGFLLLGAYLFALVPPQVAAEVGLASSLVVEVSNISWKSSHISFIASRWEEGERIRRMHTEETCRGGCD